MRRSCGGSGASHARQWGIEGSNVGGSSPIQRTKGPLRTKKLHRSESKSAKYIAHASTMPSIHADRCEPADKTGIVIAGCEEEDAAMGLSTQVAIGVRGISQLHKPQGTCLEGQEKKDYTRYPHTDTYTRAHTQATILTRDARPSRHRRAPCRDPRESASTPPRLPRSAWQRPRDGLNKSRTEARMPAARQCQAS